MAFTGSFPGTGRAAPEAFSTVAADGEQTLKFAPLSYVASGTISAGPCKLLSIHGFNLTPTQMWFMLFDSGSIPANGDTSFQEIVPVASNTPFSLDYGVHGMKMLTGAVFALSTTSASVTVTGSLASTMRINAQYTTR